MDRKRELREQYKNTKLNMGILIVKCNKNNKVYIKSASNLPGKINGIRFQLKTGSFIVSELQRDWNEFGENCFTIEILDSLSYDKDGSKTDYSDDLELLCEEWTEKLKSDGFIFY